MQKTSLEYMSIIVMGLFVVAALLLAVIGFRTQVGQVLKGIYQRISAPKLTQRPDMT